MISRRTNIGMLVLAILSILAVAVVLGAGFQMKWWLLGSGGGPLQGTDNSMVSAIGQPVSGQVSNGYTLYGGLYLDPSAIGLGESKIMLPVILNEVAGGILAQPAVVDWEKTLDGGRLKQEYAG